MSAGKYVYYKVTPEPVYVRIPVEQAIQNSLKEQIHDKIHEAVFNMDAAQVWRDSVNYGRIEFEQVSEKEAKDAGWFEEE